MNERAKKNKVEPECKQERTSQNRLEVDELASLLRLLSSNHVTEFRLEREGESLYLKRSLASASEVKASSSQDASLSIPAQPISASVLTETSGAITGKAEIDFGTQAQSSNLEEVKSPMVGTFYRRPAVDADPFVEAGDQVKKGDVLCIVEAMKIMNEVESPISGTVAEVCLEDGQMVEYGETIFRIKPA